MSSPEIKFGLEIKFGNEYGLEEEQAVLEVLRKNAPTSGDACVQFEKDFAAYSGTAHARVVTNGTAALFLSLWTFDDSLQATLECPAGAANRDVELNARIDGRAAQWRFPFRPSPVRER